VRIQPFKGYICEDFGIFLIIIIKDAASLLSLSDETQITKHFLKSVNVLHLTIQGGGEVLA